MNHPPQLPPPLPHYPHADENRPLVYALLAALVATVLLAFILALVFAIRPQGSDLGATSSDSDGAAANSDAADGSPSDQPTGTDSSQDSTEIAAASSDSDEDGARTSTLDEHDEADSVGGSDDNKSPRSSIGDDASEHGIVGAPEESIAEYTSSAPTIPSFSGSGAEFFGIRQSGNSFAFVIDHSASMAGRDVMEAGTRLELAKNELLRCVRSLDENSKFSVIFFCETHTAPSKFQGCRATTKNVGDLKRYLDKVSYGGGTDPSSAMKIALGQEVDAVFLLSDGEFDTMIVNLIVNANRRKIPINTVSIAYDAETLKELSGQTGGQYRLVR